MAFVGPGDILVLQKNDGMVRRILNGVLQPGPVLDVAVHFSSERGLLGIALDPDFVNNRYVYLYYTESATGADTSLSSSTPLGNRVYRYTWNAGGAGSLTSPSLVLSLPATPGPNHNGGVIAFGPDDALYGVIGDLNRQGKTQNIPSGPGPELAGVIIRTGRDGAPLPDNPFYDPAAADPLDSIFAYGVRNSFGLTFDPLTGRLWESENGPSVFDEINVIASGFNGGWNQIMGPDARDPQGLADLWMAPGAVYRDPEFSWAVPVAPTGVAFAASRMLGCGLAGDLLAGDNNCGQLYRFKLNPARDGLSFSSAFLQDRVADNSGLTCSGEMGEILFGSGFGVITDLENGPDGRLYVVSLSLGAVYRIGPKPGAVPDRDGEGVADACDCAPADAAAFAPPAEVPRLRLGAGPPPAGAPTTLGWDAQVATTGSGTTYTVVSGDLAALRTERGFASACTDADRLVAPALADTRPAPPPGRGYYYLARATNLCADGTYGDSSIVPDPRDLLDAARPPACDCLGRTGGALISFAIVNESLTVWSTNGTFIDRAKTLLATGQRQVPVFSTLLDDRDCDPQWTWRPDPADMTFADFAIEVCDGLPSFVEADKPYWFSIGFCPWSAIVTAVDDRR
jgi:glucose/arabinose dehydrogenase